MPEQKHTASVDIETNISGPGSAKGISKFEKKCLYCGKLNDSVTYTCQCRNEAWFNQYRVLDLEFSYSEEFKNEVLQSFKDYSFQHPDGIIQYKALPFREHYPRQLEPVGMTPLFALKNLSSTLNAQIYIKNEGENPSGCFKDRETLIALLNTRRRGLNHVVIYSSGNAAASAAKFAQKLDMQLITFVAGDTYPEKTDFIRAHGSDVIVVGNKNTNFENGFRIFAGINAKGTFADNGFDNWSVRNPYRVQGDKTTALEIVKQLSDGVSKTNVPDFIIVPSANGSCLAGLWKGFKELRELGITSKLPKMVSAGIENASPIFRAVQRNQIDKPEKCDLSKVHPEDAKIGSTILAEEGFDSIQAAKAVLESGGLAVTVSSEQIKKALKLFLQQEKELALEQTILPEPASLISLAAIEKIRKQVQINSSDTLVSLITGHGLKAKEMVQQLLPDDMKLQNVVEHIIDQKKIDFDISSIEKGKRKNVAADVQAVVKAFNTLKHI